MHVAENRIVNKVLLHPCLLGTRIEVQHRAFPGPGMAVGVLRLETQGEECPSLMASQARAWQKASCSLSLSHTHTLTLSLFLTAVSSLPLNVAVHSKRLSSFGKAEAPGSAPIMMPISSCCNLDGTKPHHTKRAGSRAAVSGRGCIV